MTDYTVSLNEEEVKALAYDVLDPQAWIENVTKEKVRQSVDAICVMAFEDETNTILSTPDKKKVQALLHAAGFDILRIELWPEHIKQAAVGLANIKSAAERLAELEGNGA